MLFSCVCPVTAPCAERSELFLSLEAAPGPWAWAAGGAGLGAVAPGSARQWAVALALSHKTIMKNHHYDVRLQKT